MAEKRINPTKILIEEISEIQGQTASGIIIPSAVVKYPASKGKVLIVGKGTPDIEIVYKVGDVVLFNPNAGQKFEFEGKEVRLLDVSHVYLGGI